MPYLRSSPWLLLVAMHASGCGGDDADAIDVPPLDCAAGQWRRNDGVCVRAGLPPDMPCPPAEWLRDDGVCIPAGVPPDGCGEGFAYDGDRGCDAILPARPCAPGFMAVPGETTCREVAACAAGRWGDIPVEPNTQYVDASYAGMDSDGSALKPWATIQDGVDAAASGAIVAIAAGSYAENVLLSSKPIRLWGVCPELVEIVGTSDGSFAIDVRASGSEVRALAIRGEVFGVGVSGALDVLLDRVRVHDNASWGVDAVNTFGATGVTVRDSLVEDNGVVGVYGSSSEVTLERSVVRATQPDVDGTFGRGVAAESATTLAIQNSVVEQNRELGVYVAASEATVEASVVRATSPNSQGIGGRGVQVQPLGSLGSTVVIRASLLEQNHDLGIMVIGSTATVETSVIRETQPDGQGLGGRGVGVQAHAMSTTPPTLSLDLSLVEENHEVGVYVAGSQVAVARSAVRHTSPNGHVDFGHGLIAAPHETEVTAATTLLVDRSLVEGNHQSGVLAEGAEATVQSSVVRESLSNAEGYFGRGVTAQSDSAGVPARLTLHASHVEQNLEAAVFIVNSDATIDADVLRNSSANPLGDGGFGVVVIAQDGVASATITATRTEQSTLAAVGVWGARAAIGGSSFSCQAFDFQDETYQGRSAELKDLGGNLCGCPKPTETCKSVSSGLEPPEPLPAP